MDISHALALLSDLADGVNPLTGELLPDSCICNNPEIVRALYVVLQELSIAQQTKPPTKTKALPENAGKPWTSKDDSLLCALFDANTPMKGLCDRFLRTRGAISTRLVRLGKFSPQDAGLRYFSSPSRTRVEGNASGDPHRKR